MYIYAASGSILSGFLKILDLNSVKYEPLFPSEENEIGFIETDLEPEEVLPFLEVARGCKVSIVPLRPEDIRSENVRHKIRRNYADMGYVTDKYQRTIHSTTSIKAEAIN